MKTLVNGVIRGIETVVFFLGGTWLYYVISDIIKNVEIVFRVDGLEYVDWLWIARVDWDTETKLVLLTIALTAMVGSIGFKKLKNRINIRKETA